jgi:hypothetical protein
VRYLTFSLRMNFDCVLVRVMFTGTLGGGMRPLAHLPNAQVDQALGVMAILMDWVW